MDVRVSYCSSFSSGYFHGCRTSLDVERMSKYLTELTSQGLYRCYKCRGIKPLSEFYKHTNGRIKSPCKACLCLSPGHHEYLFHLFNQGLSQCAMCKETKPLTEFHKSIYHKRKISPYCKTCKRKIAGSRSREEASSALLGDTAKFYLTHFEKMTETDIAQACGVSRQRIHQLENIFKVCKMTPQGKIGTKPTLLTST